MEEAMVILQDQKQSSSYPLLLLPPPPPPHKGMETEKPFGQKPPCFQPTTTSNALNANANPMMFKCRKRKAPVRVTVESLYDSSQAQSSVLERAKKIEASLDHKFPSLLKVMMPSEVSGGFYLNLAKKFRSEYMPKQDSMIVLEDENGKEFGTKYLVEKGGLSGGWRGFSIAHKIMKGDVVIFHLATPFKFKSSIWKLNHDKENANQLQPWRSESCKDSRIHGRSDGEKGMHKRQWTRTANASKSPDWCIWEVYIVRSNEVDWSLPLMRVDPPIRQMDTGGFTACGKEERENLEPNPQENAIVCYTDSGPTSDQSGNDGEDVGSEFLDGLRLSESVVTFKEVHCLDNFNVQVNGLIINSEFSKYVLTKYYELCCSQNSFLHEQLLEGLNCKLIAGVISETVNIADAIRACKITTPEDYLSTWDKTLKAFGDLGMNVRFLRARLDQLTSLASKSKGLEANVLEVKEAMNSLDSEIETPNTSLEEREILFQEMAKAPW